MHKVFGFFCHRRRTLAITAICICALGAIGVFGWSRLTPTPVADPFSSTVTGSVSFPLYYPTILPSGFHINTTSITTPQSGVVVFSLNGPKTEKLYVSEEARPSTFNFGPFLKNIANSQSEITSFGTLEVGHTNNGQTTIGTLITSKTWVVTNTNAPLPLSQLKAMLQNVLISH